MKSNLSQKKSTSRKADRSHSVSVQCSGASSLPAGKGLLIGMRDGKVRAEYFDLDASESKRLSATSEKEAMAAIDSGDLSEFSSREAAIIQKATAFLSPLSYRYFVRAVRSAVTSADAREVDCMAGQIAKSFRDIPAARRKQVLSRARHAFTGAPAAFDAAVKLVLSGS